MTDIVEQAKAELEAWNERRSRAAELITELVAALESARTDVFLLRAQLAETEGQEPGLGQPRGRHIGDGWSGL